MYRTYCDTSFDWTLRDDSEHAILPRVALRRVGTHRDDYFTREPREGQKQPSCLRNPSTEGQWCCRNDPTGPLPTLFVAAMQRMSPPPSVVVVHYGSHWHDWERGNHSARWYEHDVRQLVSNLTAYSEWYTRREGSRPLLLVRDNFPQHFDTPSGDGSFERRKEWGDLRSHDRCKPIVWWRPASIGPWSLNHRAYPIVSDAAPAVQWLGGGFESLAPRHETHLKGAASPMGHLDDCTHHCYSPLLWEPALDHFYRAVNLWDRGAE